MVSCFATLVTSASSSFLLLSFSASDLLGIVADDQTPLWARLGSEP